jgi:membrane protease YdiL (CAAX protease family)
MGWAVLRGARRPDAISWAATLPVAVALAWPLLAGGDVPLGETACVDPFSAITVRRVALACVVLALVALLAVVHGSDLAELGLVRPARWELVVAVVGCLVLAVGGLVIGPAIARPFFGELDFPIPPAALVPAVLFGIANGVMEEVQYRGAMQGWLGRIVPPWIAIGFPALVFGIVHAGPEVLALLPVHVALLTGVGVAGGLVRARTGTLAIPIGIHVGADIALYVGLACRAAVTG